MGDDGYNAITDNMMGAMGHKRTDVPSAPTDTINHPSHYKQGGIETIDCIASVVAGYNVTVGYCIGNVVKYCARAPFKGKRLEDLRKAEWYLQRAIRLIGGVE